MPGIKSHTDNFLLLALVFGIIDFGYSVFLSIRVNNATPAVRPLTFAAFAVCLTASGAAALIYETVWARQLSHAFSSTPLTACLVLTAFMGGMSLGSGLAGARAERIAHPLVAYAALEIALAVCGITFPTLIDWTGSGYLAFVRARGGAGPWGDAMKFALFAGLLAVPSALMGATLPLLLAARPTGAREAGRMTALLYAFNSFGGVLGCLVAGFLLIESMGLAMTSRIGAMANLVAAGVACALAAVEIQRPEDESGARPDAGPGDGDAHDAPRRRGRADEPAAASVSPGTLAAGLFVSGATAMAAEVLWSRTLCLVLGSSTYSFCLMLATFIAGITAGSLLFAWRGERLGDPARVFAASQLGIGTWLLVSLPAYALLKWPLALVRLAAGATFGAYAFGAFLASAAVMMVPAVLFGLGFPAAVAAARRAGGATAPVVGRLYAFNTAGNVFGTLGTGLFLIPALGTPVTFQLTAVANLVAGGALLAATSRARLPVGRIALALVALVIAVGSDASRSWHERLAVGAFSRLRPRSIEELRVAFDRAEGFQREYFEEDNALTVAVTTSKTAGRSLWVNGKVDASDSSDMVSQVMAGQLPLLMHPAPRNVFVLGLGSGVTAAAALTHDVERVDCVEISAAVTRGAQRFADVNRAPWLDRRFNLHVDDGRHWLQLTDRRFDVIAIEPSNPWMAGISNIFTRECLEQVRDRLAPGGLVMQWTHLYEIDQQSLDQIIRTFQSVFPEARGFFLHGARDLLMVGSPQPGSLPADRVARTIAERMKRPAVQQDLQRVGVRNTFCLLAYELFSGRMLADYAGPGPLLEDNMPTLEFTAARGYYTGRQLDPPYGVLPVKDSLVAAYLGGRSPTADELYEYGRIRLAERHLVGLAPMLLPPAAPRDPRLLWLAARVYMEMGQPVAALPLAREAFDAAPRERERAETYFQTAREVESGQLGLLARPQLPETRRALEALRSISPGNMMLALQAADVAILARELDEAERHLAEASSHIAQLPQKAVEPTASAWMRVAERHATGGRPDRAIEAARRALMVDPGNAEASTFLGVRSRLEAR